MVAAGFELTDCRGCLGLTNCLRHSSKNCLINSGCLGLSGLNLTDCGCCGAGGG